ncbi:MAG: hypothetical protein QRY71_01690 [Candidatus Rhabdochlamydia sp.]
MDQQLFFCVQNADEALHVYHQFFHQQLLLGPLGKIYPEGSLLSRSKRDKELLSQILFKQSGFQH